jgi:hypothetical protein
MFQSPLIASVFIAVSFGCSLCLFGADVMETAFNS